MSDYHDELARGQARLKAGDLVAAQRHFHRAHALGHDVRCRHVMAHRGLLSVATRRCDIREMAAQGFLIAAVYLFDRPQAA